MTTSTLSEFYIAKIQIIFKKSNFDKYFYQSYSIHINTQSFIPKDFDLSLLRCRHRCSFVDAA